MSPKGNVNSFCEISGIFLGTDASGGLLCYNRPKGGAAMKKALGWIKLWIYVDLGICAGRWLWLYLDVRKHPGLYELYSAPWYMQMVPYTVWTAAAQLIKAAVCLVLYYLIRKRQTQ